MPVSTTIQRGIGGSTQWRPNWAVVGIVLGIVWWLSMIGSLIAADLRERQPHHLHQAPSVESRQAEN
jgi:hypothetical protein